MLFLVFRHLNTSYLPFVFKGGEKGVTMITIENRRFNGENHEPLTHLKSVSDAFDHFAVYELGFGGSIRELTETKVVVVTRVLHCTDTTTFSGTKEEMVSLVTLASHFAKIQGRQGDLIINTVATDLSQNPAGHKTLIVTTLAPMLVGRYTLRLAILSVFGVTDAKSVELSKKLPLKDLVAAAQLAGEYKLSISEVLN